MDPSALFSTEILAVIVAGGGVAIYLARANKESLNVKSTKEAVETISESMGHLRTDNDDLRTEVNDARAETNDARAETNAARAQANVALAEIAGMRKEWVAYTERHDQELADALAVVKQCRERIARQSAAIQALGGVVHDDDGEEEGQGA